MELELELEEEQEQERSPSEPWFRPASPIFLKIERSLVFRPARVPNTFPRVSGIDGSLAAILYELSDERTLSP
jgi:hypothetical protein